MWIGRLSYKSIVGGDDRSNQKSNMQQGRMSWGKILGRIFLPFLLLTFALQFAYYVARKYVNPAKLVVGNTVHAKDN